ncbi:MAG: hypothetical protein AAFU58_02610, partial [Pseudomonadota bacterium]
MVTINAPGLIASDDVNFSIASPEYDFDSVDGAFSGSFYSYITSGGHDISLFGSGFVFSGTTLIAGTVTMITVDLDNDDGSSDYTITGLSADAGELGGTTGEFVEEIFAGDDTITTGAGADFIKGIGGEDVISTGSGNDTIVGSNDRSTLNGGAGNDSIVGGSDNDLIMDGLGDDTVEA